MTPLLIPLLFAPLAPALGQPMDVASFGLPLPSDSGVAGVMWEDPRKVSEVVVTFDAPLPADARPRLEYWGSRWPLQRVPEDREPGGGDVGWWELGNWYHGGWRAADAEAVVHDNAVTFRMRPVNAHEYPDLKEYAAPYRSTLKVRVLLEGGGEPPPRVKRLQVFTDSVWAETTVHLALKTNSATPPGVTVFNGALRDLQPDGPGAYRLRLWTTRNPDPNAFDRTLATVKPNGAPQGVTFAPDDLKAGPLFIPSAGLAVTPGDDSRDYSALAAAQEKTRGASLYDRVKALPERTWRAAWSAMPPKRSFLYLPLGADGGRHRFMLRADGSVQFRTNNGYLEAMPGKDTPRLKGDAAPLDVSFNLPERPDSRAILDETLPLAHTTWVKDGLRWEQEAFATLLDGGRTDSPVPPADAFGVCLLRFTVTNPTSAPLKAALPMTWRAGDAIETLRVDERGFVQAGKRLRAWADPVPGADGWAFTLEPNARRILTLKIPYVALTTDAEREALAHLDVDAEHAAVAGYWRRRLDESARLITPEPMLNTFYRAHAGHLLINSEREPGGDLRFARVGSFTYGAYGNESCMMVADLDRRGYTTEAQQVLDGWLKYQGTVALPGDFSGQDGVLYGAGGYEAGGYNQHHGWILWALAEHFRTTRDTDWLKRAAPGILKAADWIIRERTRTADRDDLARGLLPAGSLEDIADWWPWLSTNAYTWRGLDSAAWALERLHHPDAARLRREADAYHKALLAAFRAAAERSPVVRLRDGTAVPHFPSQPYRRGRSFGWITETLEGALHLLITRALPAHSEEADWILKDYEDNLYLSNQYGYTLDDFDKYWFGRGGVSMQACLLLEAEPFLDRDDVKPALRAIFNAIAVGYFPDVAMLTEHALPDMGDWRGDHYKSSDEANAAGWLRQLFVREEGDTLLIGQAVPRDWLKPGQRCGIERTATYFGPVSAVYEGTADGARLRLEGPKRNPPRLIRVRFRLPDGKALRSVTVNGKAWPRVSGEWVDLPGDIGAAEIVARAEG